MQTKLTQTVFALLTAQMIASCKFNEELRVKKQNQKPEAASYDSVLASEIANISVQPINQGGDTSEAQIALTEAELMKNFAAKLSEQWATTSGVLPQVLTPSVRSELNSNGMIAFINKIPGLGSTLLGSFTNDQAINEKVTSGVVDKLTTGLSQNGGSNIKTRLKINFDHFVKNRSDQKSAVMLDQAARWNISWSINGIWNNSKPLDGVDHGLQMLGVLRTLSEWSYIFGINPDGNVSTFGGLVKRIENGTLTQVRAVAPNDQLFSQQIITGSFQLSAPPNISAFDLATKGGERWSSTTAPVTLIEQSSIWISGAKAFSRLRVDRSQSASGLYRGSKPMLSTKMLKLPLAFLTNMGSMLSNNFVNEKDQKFYATACPTGNCELADARSVARLALALSLWIDATQNIQSSGIDAETATKVSDGLPKLKKALQLAVRTLSGDLTEPATEGGKQILRVNLSAANQDTSSTSAEVIGTLAKIERSQLSSPLLKERIATLAQGHAATYFTTPKSLTSVEATAWNARMIKELGRTFLNSELDWLNKVKSNFQTSLGSDWNE